MLNFSDGDLDTKFFGHTKFKVKSISEFLHLQSTVDSEFFPGGSGYQLFLVTPNLRSKTFLEFFPLPSTLD